MTPSERFDLLLTKANAAAIAVFTSAGCDQATSNALWMQLLAGELAYKLGERGDAVEAGGLAQQVNERLRADGAAYRLRKVAA